MSSATIDYAQLIDALHAASCRAAANVRSHSPQRRVLVLIFFLYILLYSHRLYAEIVGTFRFITKFQPKIDLYPPPPHLLFFIWHLPLVKLYYYSSINRFLYLATYMVVSIKYLQKNIKCLHFIRRHSPKTTKLYLIWSSYWKIRRVSNMRITL